MLSKFSVKKPLTVVVVVLIVLILGVVSYTSIGVDLYPEMNMPYLIVATILPGASPEEIEGTVTDPLEAEISSMSGISSMTSVSSEHVSMVILELNTDEDLDSFVSELGSVFDMVAWPDNDLLQDPIVVKLDPAMLPIMTVAMGRENYTTQESTEYFKQLINSIDKVDGVSNVSTSGLVSNMTFVNVDENKLNESLVKYVSDIFGISFDMPKEMKDTIREELRFVFTEVDNNPTITLENGKTVELKKDGEYIAENILQYKIIPWIEEGIPSGSTGTGDINIFNIMGMFGTDIANELRKEDSQVREASIGAIENVSKQLYVLESGNGKEENEAMFDSILDRVTDQVVSIATTSMLGSMGDMMKVDLFDLLFTAQDFEMPAGSITVGETSWIVKVGETIKDRDELYNLPLMTVDLASTMEEYVEQIQSILKMVGSATEDGKATFTEEQLKELSEMLSMFNEGTLEDKEDYAIWAINYIADNINVPAYRLDEDARNAWIATLNTHAEFGKYYTDVITGGSTTGGSTTGGSTSWRSGLLNLIVEEEIYLNNDTILNGENKWTDMTKLYFDMQISGNAGAIMGLEAAYDNMDGETQAQFESMFKGLNADGVYNRITDMLNLVGNIAGEGTVVENDDKSYTVDFALINSNLEARQDEFKIGLMLGDVSNISFLDDSGSQIATLITNNNGEFVSSSSVQIYVEKESDASTATITEQIKTLLADKAEADSDFSYTILDDDGELINMMVSGVLENLIWGAVFAAIVLFLFLRKIKATLIVVSSILISVVATFVMMYFAGMTLNLISMGGLTLGVGMLVDNSIVVLENIYRMRAQGKSVYVSAVQGAKQISPAIFASTLTTIIVFLPVLFISGMTKEVIADMALTITFSLVASLISALCVVPMTSSLMKNDKPPKEGKLFGAFKTGYAKLLNKALNNKAIVIVVVVALFVVSALGATTMELEFFSAADEGGLTISAEVNTSAVTLKNNGISKDDEKYYSYDMAVQDTVDIIKNNLQQYEEVQTIGIAFSTGMSIGGMSLGGNTISASVSLNDYRDRDMSTAEIIADINTGLADDADGLFTFTIAENTAMDDVSSFISDDISISYYSDNLTTLLQTGSDLSDKISKIEGVTSVSDGSTENSEQYMLIVDKEKASDKGLTIGQAYLQISALIKEPGQMTDISLEKLDSEETEDFGVYVLESNYTALSWYMSDEVDGDSSRIYFKNNVGGIDGQAEYFVKNATADSVYVKNISKVEVDGNKDGKIDQTAIDNAKTIYSETEIDTESAVDVVYNLHSVEEVVGGGYIPVNYDKAGTFSYNKAVVKEVVTENNGVVTTEHQIVYENKEYKVSDFTAYSSYFTDDIDLMMLQLKTESMIAGDDFVPKSFPLYEILSDKCFIKDANGDVIYRSEGDAFSKIPVDAIKVAGYASINRENGARMGTLTIKFDSLNYESAGIKAQITKILDEYESTPHGDLVIDRDTSNAIMTDVFNTLYLVLGLAIVLIYLVMVAQFQSIKSPFIIMFTIPLAFTGSLALLLIMGFEMSLLALLGLIVLMGIVVNNGIVFVDYANKLIENGTPKREALIRTGIDRIRPILMTALTTIMAMLVMAVDTSMQGVMLRPLAVATIGGLTYATVLTLFFVPIIYDLFNRKEKDFSRIKALESSEMEEGLIEEGEDVLMPKEQAILDSIIDSQKVVDAKRADKKGKRTEKSDAKKHARLLVKREKVLKNILQSRNKNNK